MGLESKRGPPLPAPTETESTTPTELATDVSRQPADDKSSYSLPEDGTPVTIKTRGHKASKSQTSLLIEYFEGGNPGPSGSGRERKPSVRVRVTPSKKSKGGDHVQITETRSSRKVSHTRRVPLTPTTSRHLDVDPADADEVSSYASATEESNVSRNPIDIEIDRGGRRRRPASPLIPAADSKAGYQLPAGSDISAIPTNSFLDGSAPIRTPEGKHSKSPSRVGEALAAGAAGAAIGALAAEKMSSNKTREKVSGTRSSERKSREKLDNHKTRSSKSRTSSLGERRSDDVRSPSSGRRKSNKDHTASMLSQDSSVLSSNLSPSHRSLDAHSTRSNASKQSINNPKLLETVEDAIRRLILPELSALKREQSQRDSSGRRGSVTSSGTTASREDLATDRRRSADRRAELKEESIRQERRRDREGRHDYSSSSPRSTDRVSYTSSVEELNRQTPRKSSDKLKAAGMGLGAGMLAAMGLQELEDKKQRRKRRDHRSRSAGRDRYAEEYEDEEHHPVPPMPLNSEINPSELTRSSILSANTDRPHSATEELTPVHEVSRGNVSVDSTATPTPTQTPNALQQTLGTKHANISHGDLKTLSTRRKTGEYGPEDPEHSQGHQDEEYQEEYDEDVEQPVEAFPPQGSEYQYYHTQDVPAPLNYEPYRPHERGLSPILSVSGYTEGGSEAQAQRNSRATYPSVDSSPEKSPYHDMAAASSGSAPSNARSREFDEESVEDRNSGLDYRNPAYTENSEVDHVTSGQAVQGVGANPRFVNVPAPAESAVASLVDGSMLDQSVLTTGSGYDYGHRGSTLSYDDQTKSLSGGEHASPTKYGLHSHREEDGDDYDAEDREATPVSAARSSKPDYVQEYDIDQYGRKVPASTHRHIPNATEAAIAAGALGMAAKAIKDRDAANRKPTAQEEHEEEDYAPAGAGVARNRSFKERTQAGSKPANTPSHSVDRLMYEEPKMGASGVPDLHDPLPDFTNYVDDDQLTQHSAADARHEVDNGEEDVPLQADYHQYLQEARNKSAEDRHGLGISETIAAGAAGALAGAAAGHAAANHSHRPSQELDAEYQRNSNDGKRDTWVTNPFENTTPVVNPALGATLLGNRDLPAQTYHPGFQAASPNLGDEGYISQGPVRSPDVMGPSGAAKGKGVDFMDAPGGMVMAEDPFYVPGAAGSNPRHLSGMSHGMESPFYDAATGEGMDRIESKDIFYLMQHLTVRDAERDARSAGLLTAVVAMAAEMRNEFDNVKKLLAETEDVVIREVQDHTTTTIHKAINGPRPMPGSAQRSIQGGGSQSGTTTGNTVDDIPVKKRNLLRNALLGLGAKGTTDFGRIEGMLMQLLSEVGDLKQSTHTNGNGASGQGQSYENMGLQPEGEGAYEQDHGYEPEGNAGTSTASHPSQSGHFSVNSRGPSTKLGYERKFSDHRISTVPEDNEDEYDQRGGHALNRGELNDDANQYAAEANRLTPGPGQEQRATSLPMETPPQAAMAAIAPPKSYENTPKTEKSRKHKSGGSSSWFPKISRWSETTTSSITKPFRSSVASRRDKHDDGYGGDNRASRSSDLGGYDQGRYGDADELAMNQPLPLPQDMLAPPRAFMTPEDPKYKAHRNSLNLQHPQPRPGQTELFKANLESQAHEFDSPMSPRSAEWAGSATSLHRLPPNANRYSDGSAAANSAQHQEGRYWSASPQGGPPRPPKEPLDDGSPARRTPPGILTGQQGSGNKRFSRLQKGSPLPHQSIESGYVTGPGTATRASFGGGSPKPENKNLSGAFGGVPTRKPSGPRAMTPRSAEEEALREERRRKRDTFGTIASQDTDTF